MKKRTTIGLMLALICSWSTQTSFAEEPFSKEIQEEPEAETEAEENDNEHDLYIDGQRQTYAGGPMFEEGVLYVSIQAAVRVLNEKTEIDSDVTYADESPFDFLEENDYIEELNGQEVVRVSSLQELGIRAEWLDNPGRLHLETADQLTVGDLQIGDSLSEVDAKLDVHWNTGYGQAADYIGFHGDMHDFTFTNRFGETRSGEVPDMQLEITDNKLTYMIFSSSDFETARGAEVGDTLFDVQRAHGSEYIEETIDGKTVYIYHVNGGSLWFIANDDREVERIGVWAFQVEGYER